VLVVPLTWDGKHAIAYVTDVGPTRLYTVLDAGTCVALANGSMGPSASSAQR
jgi:hypothetical protein